MTTSSTTRHRPSAVLTTIAVLSFLGITAVAGGTLLLLGHVSWIGLELIYLPEPSVLQFIYGPIGVALTVLPFLRSVRDYLGTHR